MCGMRYLLVYLHSRVCWTNVPPGRNFVQVYYVRNGQIARSEPCCTVEPANTGGVGSACFTDLDSPQHETRCRFSCFQAEEENPYARYLLALFASLSIYFLPLAMRSLSVTDNRTNARESEASGYCERDGNEGVQRPYG